MRFKNFTETELNEQHLDVLRALGRAIGVKSPTSKNKFQLIREIMAIRSGEMAAVMPAKKGAPPKIEVDLSQFLITENDNPLGIMPVDRSLHFADCKKEAADMTVEGIFEDVQTYGFLRANNFDNSADDAYMPPHLIRKYNVRRGDRVRAVAKFVKDNELPAIQNVISVNGCPTEDAEKRANFDELVPCYPTEKLKLERVDDADMTARIIDLFAPIGKGQRGLIVAPPKTGKTTLLKNVAKAIEQNYPKVKLIVLLVDERPEEVTDLKRSIKGEVVYSTFDESAEHHVKIAELVASRAKGLVEMGKDVVVLLDSITRLARAYNNVVESSGKVLSGGIDPTALHGPKRFFGSARNIENGGSLTVIATALVETGSRMDDVIYEEFKGTGNMEIHLSRALSERRIFPAIDLYKSGTRKEELLLSPSEIDAARKLRRILADKQDAILNLTDVLQKTKGNEDLISKIDAWLKLFDK